MILLLTQRLRCVILLRVIPDFEKTGLLPAGIHWAAWEEVALHFGTNSHRRKLLGGLRRGAEALKVAGCTTIYLDGSFVTTKPLPRDYDACWEMAGVTAPKLDPVFLDSSNQRAAQKRKYLGEFFPAYSRAEGPPLYRMYINFLQVDKETGAPKGIVGIKL
jgi:hypothetical protein